MAYFVKADAKVYTLSETTKCFKEKVSKKYYFLVLSV